MSKKFHMAASGKEAGYFVECKAKQACTLQYSDGSKAVHTEDPDAAKLHNSTIRRQVEKQEADYQTARRSARFGQKIDPETGKTINLTPEERQNWLHELNEIGAEQYANRIKLAGLPALKTPATIKKDLENKIKQQIVNKEGSFYDKYMQQQLDKHRQEVYSITQDPEARLRLEQEWATEDAEKEVELNNIAPIGTDEEIQQRKELLEASPDRRETAHKLDKNFVYGNKNVVTNFWLENKANHGTRKAEIENLQKRKHYRYIEQATQDGWEAYEQNGSVYLTKYSTYNKGLYTLKLEDHKPEIEGSFLQVKIGSKPRYIETSLTPNNGLTAAHLYNIDPIKKSLNTDSATGKETDFNQMVHYGYSSKTLPKNVYKAQKRFEEQILKPNPR